MFNPKKIYKVARKLNKTIVFPEASFSERIVEAGKIIRDKKIANVIFVGDESNLILKYKNLKNITIINPKTSDIRQEIEDLIFEKRQAKGITPKKAKELSYDPIYFATMLVEMGIADGMVAGAETATSDSLRPALQLIKGKDGGYVSSCNIVFGKNRVLGKERTLVIGDSGLNVEPSANELMQVALNMADFAKNVCDIFPKVAMLSFSTHGSAVTSETKKVAQATELLKNKRPDLVCDGEIQLDAAICPKVAEIKCPESPLKGRANVLVFPELQSGNICYKAIERFGNLKSFGPIVLGLNKPVNDLSRGCTVEDIIMVTALTVMQTGGENK